jgi:hypothetical protein
MKNIKQNYKININEYFTPNKSEHEPMDEQNSKPTGQKKMKARLSDEK